MTAATPAIEVADVVKHYGDLRALDGLSLAIAPGEVFGLLGPNGAGKTTTVEILEGLGTPDAGEVEVLGERSQGDGQALRSRLGVQLQETRFPDKLTVSEVIRVFRSFYSGGLAVGEAMRLVELEEKASARVQGLSGGQKQRLSLACALVGDPEIVFLDEPTTGLDPQSRRQTWDILTALKRRGRTLLLTTHYMEEAQRLCDRVAIIDHGRIVEVDTPDELVRRHCPERTIAIETLDERAAGALAGVEGVTAAAREGGRVLVQARSVTAMTGIIACLAAQRIAVSDFQTFVPTLEDVFLRLTGHSVRQ
jgi:ABC-2 type transport system ATP-binding protein